MSSDCVTPITFAVASALLSTDDYHSIIVAVSLTGACRLHALPLLPHRKRFPEFENLQIRQGTRLPMVNITEVVRPAAKHN